MISQGLAIRSSADAHLGQDGIERLASVHHGDRVADEPFESSRHLRRARWRSDPRQPPAIREPGVAARASSSIIRRMDAAHSNGYRCTFWGLPALGKTHVTKSPTQSAWCFGTHAQVWSSVSPRPWCNSSSSPPTSTSDDRRRWCRATGSHSAGTRPHRRRCPSRTVSRYRRIAAH